LRKPIRPVAAAGFSSGEVKRFGRDLRTKPELTAARQSYSDRLLIGPERLPSPRGFVVKQDAVAGIHPIGLAVIHRDPVGVQLGHTIGAARIEGRTLLLGDLLHQAVELTGAGLVDAGFLAQAEHPHRLQNPQGAERIAVGRVFRRLEAHRHVALGAKVVDLIRLHLLDDPDQVGAVGEVAVVQREAGIALMWVLVEVVDPGGVEAAGPPLDAVHAVALLQQQFGQVAAVLACDAGNQG
jgi:hypothetical protein